jgi:O-antigen/teichoic acid export membrane protein
MMLRAQGAMVLVNRMFNPVVNASWALSRTVSDKSNTLAESIKGAMVPAIVQACGAGDMVRMHSLVSRMCKFSLAAAMLVAVPLMLEMPEVLRIWLKNPPPRLAGLAVCVFMEYLLLVSTSGYDTAVYAKGRLALYQCVTGVFLFGTLPAMYVVHRLGGGVYAVATASLIMIAGYCGARLVVASRIVGMRVRDWLRRTVLPVGTAAAAAAAAGSISVLSLSPGWTRVLLTACASMVTFVVMLWRFALDDAERLVVRQKILVHLGAKQ